MKRLLAWPLMISVGLSILGCSRTEKVRAIEGVVESPYESLGTLEVKVRAPRFTASQLFLYWPAEILTLGFAHTPSRSDIYRSRLDKLITKRARKNFQADAVIHVRYWPDLESSSFPGGKVYARGEMVRLKKFPGDTQPKAETPAAPNAQN